MRLLSFRSVSTSVAALLLAACQMVPPPASPGDGSPEVGGGPGVGGASAPEPTKGPTTTSATSKAEAAPRSAAVPTTVEIHSDCGKTLPVFYGDKPKFGSGTKSQVSSNSTSSQGRNSD